MRWIHIGYDGIEDDPDYSVDVVDGCKIATEAAWHVFKEAEAMYEAARRSFFGSLRRPTAEELRLRRLEVRDRLKRNDCWEKYDEEAWRDLYDDEGRRLPCPKPGQDPDLSARWCTGCGRSDCESLEKEE